MKTWASRLAVLGSLATLIFVLLGLPLWMFGLPLVLEQRARSFAPPAYPNAVPLKTTLASAAGEATEITVYRVADDLKTVQRWMESRSFRFGPCDMTTAPDCLFSEHCDDSMLTRVAAQALQLGEADQRTRACVSLVLEPDDSTPHHTFVHVNIGWPSDN